MDDVSMNECIAYFKTYEQREWHRQDHQYPGQHCEDGTACF